MTQPFVTGRPPPLRRPLIAVVIFVLSLLALGIGLTQLERQAARAMCEVDEAQARKVFLARVDGVDPDLVQAQRDGACWRLSYCSYDATRGLGRDIALAADNPVKVAYFDRSWMQNDLSGFGPPKRCKLQPLPDTVPQEAVAKKS